MRILFLATNFPLPVNNGQAMRTLSIVRALASVGHEVSFVSSTDRGIPENVEALSKWCHVAEVVPQKLKNLTQSADYSGRLLCMLKSKPYAIERFRSSAMQAIIAAHLKTGDFDAVVADSIYALINVPSTTAPVVLNCHNVESMILERYARLEKKLLKSLYARWEGRLMRQAEGEACSRSSLAIACSQYDRDILSEFCPKLTIFVVPNAIDSDFYVPSEVSDERDDAPVLLFQGGMDWYPNRDAVEFFVHQILPSVHKSFPAVKFVAAGRNPSPDFVASFAGINGIEFTGTVPDMKPYIARATVVVVPLRVGSGTRLKILEAGAMAKPIVSTTVGAEGLELQPGKDLLIADNPGAFAEAINTLLRNAQLRHDMGCSVRRNIIDRYSQVAVEKSVACAMSSLVKGSPEMAVTHVH